MSVPGAAVRTATAAPVPIAAAYMNHVEGGSHCSIRRQSLGQSLTNSSLR
ncbi:MAG TPA: hypothetical protein VKS82_13370 [Streptosporangiaceae bacterium]|nr:hypothetical protein [Streptosporangiaceae bacterium]